MWENTFLWIRVSGTDIILDTFGSAGHRVVHIAVQNFMELKDIVLRDRNGFLNQLNLPLFYATI